MKWHLHSKIVLNIFLLVHNVMEWTRYPYKCVAFNLTLGCSTFGAS